MIPIHIHFGEHYLDMITLDTDLEEQLGRVYLSGVSSTNMFHPTVISDELDLCYGIPCNQDKPTILLSSSIDSPTLDLVKKKRVVLVVPMDTVRELTSMGWRINGILVYGTMEFWMKLLLNIIPLRYIDVLYHQFQGHVSLLRIIGAVQNELDPLREYQNVTLYHDYGLGDRTVETIEKINTLLLEENKVTNPLETKKINPVKIKMDNKEIIEQLKMVHPKSIEVTESEIYIKSFF